MPILSIFDIVGIQSFVFGSSRLSDNLGASWLVRQVLGPWLDELAGRPVLWSGGGNAAVQSDDLEAARSLATQLSATLLERAPGLEVVVAHVPWDGGDATYGVAAAEAHRLLAAHKTSRVPAALFDGGGVCTPCWVTGAPAVRRKDEHGEDRPIGRSVVARRGAADKAHERMKALMELPERMVWTRELDKLGRAEGSESAIAVVHVDGNAMGERFEEASRKGLAAVRALSARVDHFTERALCDALQWVADSVDDGRFGPRAGGFALYRGDDGAVFPVRPIIYGGDDLTLVCNGRIALDLAAKLLSAWHLQSGDLAVHACAGVAIVGPHEPFSRAVDLAERLCRRAKRWQRDRGLTDASSLDWALCRSGETELETTPARSARPYVVVGSAPEPFQRWDWFRWELLWRLRAESGLHEAHPSGRRRIGNADEAIHTRLKGLAPALREGLKPTRRRLSEWKARFDYTLPATSGTLETDGFVGDLTPYLDALELMDLLAVAKELP